MDQKHILMVDDVTTNLKCAGEVLKDTYKLSMAKSGKQALQFLKKAKPDLILLDINMPDMDGYQTMKKIKSNPDFMDIPVVFLTADSETESEIEGFRLGAMDFIRKPFEPEVLLGRIDKILQIEETKKLLTIEANKDVLTGLWNRKYFEQNINKAGIDGEVGTFILFDMDNFKLINNNFGHIMGDEVLIKFSEALVENTKDGDIACRLGGDEFALFLKEETDSNDLENRMRKLLEEIELHINFIQGQDEHVSVSAGIALMPKDGVDFITLYNKADKALYHVKQNGKRGYHLYHDKEQYSFSMNGDTHIDLMLLRNMFEERDIQYGAYHIEYQDFKRIYQFVERCVERSNQEVQIVLFTLNGIKVENASLTEIIHNLNEVISGALRKGDVATRYSNTQYVVILMDASLVNGRRVAERVIKKCSALCEKAGLVLKYDIQSVKKESES